MDRHYLQSTRRTFLAGAGAAATVAASNRALAAGRLAGPGAPAIALFQTGSEPAGQFGARLSAQGLVTAPIDHDISALWVEHLSPLWRRQRAPVVGLTTVSALFCLEKLAWDAGLRVVFRGDHVRPADGDWSHRFDMAAEPHRAVMVLGHAGQRWGAAAADLALTQVAPGSQRDGMGIFATADEHLVSWAIAPAATTA